MAGDCYNSGLLVSQLHMPCAVLTGVCPMLCAAIAASLGESTVDTPHEQLASAEATPAEVEAFLRCTQFEERAIQGLRALSLADQKRVIDRGISNA
jgi:hypothetical protein